MEKKTITGLILILIFVILMMISVLKKQETFFNIRKTVKLHLSLFKTCKFQYVVFYGFPIIFAIGLALIYEANAAFYSEISVVIGILLSMLLAILSILTGYDFSFVDDKTQKAKVQAVVKETINAIVFDSILCIFMMIYDLTIIATTSLESSWITIDPSIIKAGISGIAYYIFIVILLTLLLIVKHMSKIIEFKNIKNR